MDLRGTKEACQMGVHIGATSQIWLNRPCNFSIVLYCTGGNAAYSSNYFDNLLLLWHIDAPDWIL